MELWLAFATLILAIIGTPLYIVMSIFGLGAFYLADIDISAMSVEIYRLANSPTLLTIPLFTLAGTILAKSNSPKRLLNFASSAFSWMPGGVAIVSLVTCAFFTAFTGASGVTIIALGGLLYPMLRDYGYNENFSLGLMTTSGSLGLLFAPSLPLILYGIVAKVDISQLFIAGIIPGIFLILVLSLYAIWSGKSFMQRKPFVWDKFKTSLWQAKFELFIAPLTLGFIYLGIVTLTEASALCAFYVILLNFIIHKDLTIKNDLGEIIKETTTLVGSILIILCCALGVTNYLIDEQVPMKILDIIQQNVESKFAFLILLNVFLLIVGSLMDIFSAIIVVVPLILPLANQFDIHPVHLAIIFLTNLEIGYITPPVGINLFIASFRFEKPILQLYKASFPYLILLLFSLLVITYWPEMSLIWIK
jgi:C4-dicarboxylate transporter DctM subunit